jgi:hypothetical protein
MVFEFLDLAYDGSPVVVGVQCELEVILDAFQDFLQAADSHAEARLLHVVILHKHLLVAGTARSAHPIPLA